LRKVEGRKICLSVLYPKLDTEHELIATPRPISLEVWGKRREKESRASSREARSLNYYRGFTSGIRLKMGVPGCEFGREKRVSALEYLKPGIIEREGPHLAPLPHVFGNLLKGEDKS